MAKEGSTIGGLMDVLGTSISIGLQYGVPLEVFVNKFAHSRFEPAGFTKNPDIPIAKSIADYIFRWLGMEFIDGYREANAPQRPTEDVEPSVTTPVIRVNGHRSATMADLEHAEAVFGAEALRVEPAFGGNRKYSGAGEAIRSVPERCSSVRQLRCSHCPMWDLLSVLQLRQQHGLLVAEAWRIAMGTRAFFAHGRGTSLPIREPQCRVSR